VFQYRVGRRPVTKWRARVAKPLGKLFALLEKRVGAIDAK